MLRREEKEALGFRLCGAFKALVYVFVFLLAMRGNVRRRMVGMREGLGEVTTSFCL